jgi:ankyrin repeat protein
MPTGWRGLMALGSAVILLGAGGRDIPPLVAGAKDADWDAVRTLVGQGVDVNTAYGDGTTALHWASYWDNVQIADLLIRAGADVNAATDLGVTPLWPASQNGSASMVQRLLEAGGDPGAALLSGETLVMTAARSGNPDVVRGFLAAGADPNASATRGQTALMWAAGQEHSGVVEVLLEYGADVLARSDVRTQLMKTDKAQESNPDYHLWVDLGGNTALVFAARSGNLRSAELLVEAGAEVNHTAAFGISATITAVHGGNTRLVEYLLEQGADPNSADGGYTALHAAILSGNEAAVRVLLAHGAGPSARVQKATPTLRGSEEYHFHQAFVGATPFWLAARFSQPNVMQILLEYGADPLFVHDVSYPAGNSARQFVESEGAITALMAAVGMGGGRFSGFYRPAPNEAESVMLEAVRIAVEAGVDVNATDAAGRTAVDAPRYESVVAFLVGSGASVPNR